LILLIQLLNIQSAIEKIATLTRELEKHSWIWSLTNGALATGGLVGAVLDIGTDVYFGVKELNKLAEAAREGYFIQNR